MDRARNQVGESIDIVNAGKRPYEAYFCPECGNRLILRLGHERQCFAHQPGVAPECGLRAEEGSGGASLPSLGGDTREVGRALVRAFCNYFDSPRLAENDAFLDSDTVTRAQLVTLHLGHETWGLSRFPPEQQDTVNVLSRLISADLAGALRQVLAALIQKSPMTDFEELPKRLVAAAPNIHWESYFSGMGDRMLLPSPWIECDEPVTLVYHEKHGRFGPTSREVCHDVRFRASVILEKTGKQSAPLKIARLRRDADGNRLFETSLSNARTEVARETQALIIYKDPISPARLYMVFASPAEAPELEAKKTPPIATVTSAYTKCNQCGNQVKATNVKKHARRCERALERARERQLRARWLAEQDKLEAAAVEDAKRRNAAILAAKRSEMELRAAQKAEEDRIAAERAEEVKRRRDAIAATEAPAHEAARIYAESTVMRPEMVRIQGGTFWMGSSPDDGDAVANEHPRHEVTVFPYWIAKAPVTQKVYAEVTGERPAYKVDDNAPVSLVSWLGAIKFCNLLSTKHGLAPVYKDKAGAWVVQPEANGYRLPTEAEWEYAARGSDGRTYPWGSAAPSPELCWGVIDGARWEGPYPVGGHPAGASAFGLLDMVGNVRELVADRYGRYHAGPVSNPLGPDPGSRAGHRVLRGIALRAASRGSISASARTNMIGFRVARGDFPPVASIRSPPLVPQSNFGAIPRTQSPKPQQPVKPHKAPGGTRALPVPPSLVNGNRKVEGLHEGGFVRCPHCAPGVMVRGDVNPTSAVA